MIVVIAGIKRSGSTAQFNMVRLILEKAFSEVHVTGNPKDLKAPCTIVKIHTFDKTLFEKADHVFTTSRDLVEIQESLSRFNRPNSRNMRQMMNALKKWRKKSLHMHYKEITNSPLYCINRIAHTFDFKIDSSEILKEFEAIKPPTDKDYDARTMLFCNHITK